MALAYSASNSFVEFNLFYVKYRLNYVKHVHADLAVDFDLEFKEGFFISVQSCI